MMYKTMQYVVMAADKNFTSPLTTVPLKVTAVALSALVLGGCSLSDSESSVAAVPDTTVTAAAEGPVITDGTVVEGVQAPAVADLLKKTQEALNGVETAHAVMTNSLSDQDPIKASVEGAADDSYRTVTSSVGANTISFIGVDDNYYLKANKEYWTAMGMPSAADKPDMWYKAGPAFAQFAEQYSLDSVLSNIVPTAEKAISDGTIIQYNVDGHNVWRMLNADGSIGMDIDVETSLPTRFVGRSDGASAMVMEFRSWNESSKPEKPADDKIDELPTPTETPVDPKVTDNPGPEGGEPDDNAPEGAPAEPASPESPNE